MSSSFCCVHCLFANRFQENLDDSFDFDADNETEQDGEISEDGEDSEAEACDSEDQGAGEEEEDFEAEGPGERDEIPPSGPEGEKDEIDEIPPSGPEIDEIPPSGPEGDEIPPSGPEGDEIPPSGPEGPQPEIPPSGPEGPEGDEIPPGPEGPQPKTPPSETPMLKTSLTKTIDGNVYKIERKKEKAGRILIRLLVNSKQKMQIREDIKGAAEFALGLFNRLGKDLKGSELYTHRTSWLQDPTTVLRARRMHDTRLRIQRETEQEEVIQRKNFSAHRKLREEHKMCEKGSKKRNVTFAETGRAEAETDSQREKRRKRRRYTYER